LQDEDGEEWTVVKLFDDVGICKDKYEEITKSCAEYLIDGGQKKSSTFSVDIIFAVIPAAISYGVWLPENVGSVDYFDKLTKILEREYDDETEKKLNFCYRNS
jgi:hypothetical protein